VHSIKKNKKNKKKIFNRQHKVLLIVKRFAARFTIPDENKTALNQALSETTRARTGTNAASGYKFVLLPPRA